MPLTTSPRLSTLVLRRGRQLVEMGGVPDLQQWSQELRDHLLLHGLRFPVTIAGSVSVTSQVSRKVRQAASVPSPYPDLVPCAGVVHATEAAAMREAVKKLKLYHASKGESVGVIPPFSDASKGESVGVIPLFSDAALGEQVYPLDDPSFDVLLWCLRHRVTSQSLSDLRYWLARQPAGPEFTADWLLRACRHAGSDVTTVDDLPMSLLTRLSWSGTMALRYYTFLLQKFRAALSNVAVQLGIYKANGLRHVFTSFRPIKEGSAPNRLEARVMHEQTSLRAEIVGSVWGCTFPYRKEVSTAHLSFACRALTAATLHARGEVHQFAGDESGAFDVPEREAVRDY